jgi:hypothetical protein
MPAPEPSTLAAVPFHFWSPDAYTGERGVRVNAGLSAGLTAGRATLGAGLHTLLRPDESVIVRAEFPAILPPIHARTTVAHVMDARQAGHSEIGLRFNEPQAELGHAIRALELRRINRAGAAA